MNKVYIYTDGGCRGNQNAENIGAWAYYMEYKGAYRQEYQAVKNTTNNIMELTAIIEALKFLKRKDIEIEVFSDSAYCVNGVNQWRHNWKKKGWVKSDKKPVENKELWIELDSLVDSFNKIVFTKVKGHADNQGNILVDGLVNRAMNEMEEK